MKFIKFWYLTVQFCILLIPSLTVAAQKELGSTVYNKIIPFVFQIKTSKRADDPKNSYGSGFVVDKNGLLITNYHVVSTVVHDENRNYKIFLVDGKKNYEAQIVNFSVIHDIALIKVNRTFKKALKLLDDKTAVGDRIFSLGLPRDLRMSIVEGIYNGVIEDGLYQRVFMTTPINAGMSGGPTVNANGEVIGVNVSHLLGSNNITFSVPIKHAIKLIKNAHETKNVLWSKEYYQTITTQLDEIQRSLIDDLKKTESKYMTLDRWKLSKPSESLKCWSSNTTSKRKKYHKTRHICYLRHGAYIQSGNYSGSYEIEYNIYKNLKYSKLQFNDMINSKLMGWSLRNLYLNYFILKGLTKYSCDDQIYVNDFNVPFKISFCTTGFIKFKGIYRMSFRAISLDQDKSIMIFKGVLNGMDKSNLLSFLKFHLSGISYN